MADDPFRSPKQTLARAQRKLGEFERAVKAFSDRRPYANVTDLDEDGVTQLHKVRLTEPLPDILTDLAQEALEALRSVLDQAGYACAILNGKPGSKSAYYPFADTGSDLANTIKGRCKDLPSDIVTLFRSFQPYSGGNDTLWAMNKIANSKHTAIEPVGNAAAGFMVKNMVLTAPAAGSASIPVPTWDRDKPEMIFGRVGPGGQFEYELEFAFYIAFGDVPVFKGQPVSAVLNHLAGEVSGILAATESECRRIRLLSA